jgi:S1-C subfamily serine protease
MPPPAPVRRPPSTLALATVAAVIAGFVGVAIGSTIFHRNNNGQPAAGGTTPGQFIPFAPVNPFGGSSSSAPTTATPAEQAVRTKVDPGVVDINTQLGFQGAAAAGTGMILTADGRILTNNHVIDGATQINATVVTTHRTYRATVVGTDPTDDVAVIQLQGATGLSPIKIGDSSAVGSGDTVYAIGNAGGVGGTPSVSSGTVQATNQTITASDQGGANAEQLSGLFQTDAPMEPGDSGGPLTLSSGAVVGMDTAASGRTRFASAASTVGFAIPIAHALSIANQINAGHATGNIHLGLPPFLGVQVIPNDTGTGSGAQIESAEPNSPASAAGLTSGDTITSVNGQPVDTPTTLTTLLHQHRPGDKVTIGWLDALGRAHQAPVTLTNGPAD